MLTLAQNLKIKNIKIENEEMFNLKPDLNSNWIKTSKYKGDKNVLGLRLIQLENECGLKYNKTNVEG